MEVRYPLGLVGVGVGVGMGMGMGMGEGVGAGAAWHGLDAMVVPLRCRDKSRIGNSLLGYWSVVGASLALCPGHQALRAHATTSARGRS